MMSAMKLDVISEAEPWYAEGLSFTCTQCGNCCTGGPGYVWISDEEIGRLAEFLKMSREEVLEKYCRRIGRRISLNEHRMPNGNYDCVFLTEVEAAAGSGVRQKRRGCSIYPVRPLQCRTWPFWDGNLSSREAWEISSERCPGMDRGGRKFSREEIEALRDAEDWPEKPPGSKNE